MRSLLSVIVSSAIAAAVHAAEPSAPFDIQLDTVREGYDG
jgi:hypothetical protein